MPEELNADDQSGDKKPPKKRIIDFEAVRAKYSYQPDVALQTEITTIPIRSPTNDEFFRCNPDPEFTMQVNALQYKRENELYLVHDSVAVRL